MLDLNAPEYKLLQIVADEFAPSFDGEFQYSSIAPIAFLSRKGKIKFPFTYDDYINDKDIIGTLKGFEIDIEQFWYATLFIYDITQEKCVNTLTLGKKTEIQIQELRNYLSEIYSFTISTDGKKKLVINDAWLINVLKNHLDTLLQEENNNLDGRSFKLTAPSNDLCSSSVQIWFAATRFIKLFETLKLPTKRSKNIAMEYRGKDGENIPIKSSIQTVYFNKLLLISQLMYLMKFTKNDSFLVSDNSLKGILKQYKNFELNTFSKVYFA